MSADDQCPTAEPVIEVYNENELVDINLTITNKAKVMLEGAMEGGNSSLLIGVLNGGCSGFKYELQLVEETDEICQTVIVEGIEVLIPRNFANMLNGIEIAYEDKLMGGGFKINNPNADRTCGCGESFS
ncbi:MAG: iron-sulfur cluster assembly accessory protein [Euryarchaeota archaeon]|jgi:iron-sulfur cluster assembly protein|nr:iron-sulfur cluster assembly accessory protein [Euryarchaeota archaeon]MBT3971319.1 iron-sulfur cluster assembly accessory protein [Euryarchaeota archaeon]MBT4406886.1 iron-sulfur cluster assembly accessory protein [Euryarchaeota archaeon]MBT6645797.1 iron-sulfur cluster assembly accessory protein [Euryarchaeota archaeon]